MTEPDYSFLRDAVARSRPASRKENMPPDFVHRTVDAATAPRPEGCMPSSPFLLALPVDPGADEASESEAPRLRVEFYRCGVTRLVMGELETFLSQRETLVLGSMLVANVAAEAE